MRMPVGLYFDEDESDELRSKAEGPLFGSFWESLTSADLEHARHILAELQEADGSRELRRVQGMLQNLAFVHALTGDEEKGRLARAAMLGLTEARYWGLMVDGDAPLGDLSTARLTSALAFAYDWTHECLASRERERALQALAEKGVEPCARMLRGMEKPWIDHQWAFRERQSGATNLTRWPEVLGECNWQAVLATGCALGAVVLRAEGHPGAAEWLDLSLRAARHYASLYASDGSYIEGTTYWNLGTRHLVMLAELFRRHGLADLYEEYDWLSRTIEFEVCMRMPWAGDKDQHGVVNFGDANWRSDSCTAFALARRFKDPLAQWAALHPPGRHSIESIIWCDPSIEPVEAPPERLLCRRFEIDWVTCRTGWQRDATVFAFRSGPPGNHEHSDRNSFVLTSGGERLIVDCGGASYRRTAPGWQMRLTAAHNTVLIDGEGQRYIDGSEGTNASIACARITDYHEEPGWVAFVSDATHAYACRRPDVRLVRRSVVWLREGAVIFVDELATEEPAQFSLRFHTDNSDGKAALMLQGEAAVLRRPRARLHLGWTATCPLKAEVGTHPLPESPEAWPYVELVTEQRLEAATLATALLPRRTAEKGATPRLARGHGGWCVRLPFGTYLLRTSEGTVAVGEP